MNVERSPEDESTQRHAQCGARQAAAGSVHQMLSFDRGRPNARPCALGASGAGMTREQVVAALGCPVTSENPNLDTPAWRYWLGSFEEFGVRFDKAGRVAQVTGRAATLLRVLVEWPRL